jgi:hypothetical protein
MKVTWRKRLFAAAPGSCSQRPWLRRLLIGTCVMVVAILAGAAIPALAGGRTVTFYACVTSKTGAIKIVSNSTACRAGQHKISWNNIGPRGPAGKTGHRGAAGPAGVVAGFHALAHGGIISTSSTTVTSLALPAGNFIVNASVTLDIQAAEGGVTNVADCRLIDGSGAVLDFSAATVVLTGNTGAATLSMTGATSTGGATKVLCTSRSPDNLDAASITAIPVHTLS